ncbi:hypothetical protein [Nocardia goodfellowii]|uniref:Uncharacterized protein n=1 Tax=Nocardia goodfellowii TaxID=882446 RepID=A0ABS4QKF5_9NOCA|nr:hypothetical protein [Nocardia goodfellowii]MBP2192186.1 hypothetical protein [Nocardia goodfellowii]
MNTACERGTEEDYASSWELATATTFPGSSTISLHYRRPDNQ